MERFHCAVTDIAEGPLDPAAAIAFVSDPGFGGMTMFAGRVRDLNHGRVVTGVSYDLFDALAKVLEDQTRQQSPGSAQQTEARTVRTELKDGHVVALESYRPKQNVGGATAKELREYAVGELAPFLELAEQGQIRALVVAAELVTDRLSITYPVGQWEPGLIAGAQLLQHRLLDQG